MKFRAIPVFVVLALVLSLPVSGVPQARKIVTEEFMVPSSDPGIQLFVRNKHLDGESKFTEEKILLFVHGATYPSETGFDIPLGGISWMDFMAQRGWDVYITDVRGYGRSTRPPQMDEPPEKNPPLAHTDEAVKDVSSVVEYILKKRGVPKINLLGWSWGTTIMGTYTAKNNSKVRRLVLYAPLWLLKEPPPIGGQGPLGAYRTVTADSARQRGLRGIPQDRQEEISPKAWFDKWWEANLATDPVGSKQNPPVLRAPNGIIDDLRKYWMSGKPYYEPSEITVPTLVILAEWDQDTPLYMAQEVFQKLTKPKVKRMVVIGEGTHAVALEKNRLQLFRETALFLEEEH